MPKVKKSKSGSGKSCGVPFATGFHPPTAKQSARAARTFKDEKLGRDFQDCPTAPHFSPIPQPTSIDDWLAQYVEEGQTYTQFLKECPWISHRKVKKCRMLFDPSGSTLSKRYPEGKVYLLPLGKFDDCAPNFSDLAEYASIFFSLKVEVLPVVHLEVDKLEGQVFWLNGDTESSPSTRVGRRKNQRIIKYRLAARFHRASGNYQLEADSLISKVDHIMPSDALCLVALTMSDIYQTPSDLFVAGLAGVRYRAGVFSFRRYDPTLSFSAEHWHEITGEHQPRKLSPQDLRVILQRSCKLLVHELSHLLCVDHCIWHSCCMNGSGHLAEDFCQSMHLCPVDLRKLQHLCGFGVRERYKRLREFFRKHGLAEEEKWVQQRLKFITETTSKDS